MLYSEYGRTGKRVSKVGFGGMRFDTSRDNEENAELLRHANRLGINYFDTAPGYCQDKSEDIFGIAFQDMPGDYWVSTKGMPTDDDTADKARSAVEKSLSRMGVEKINFYHVWCLRKMEHYHLTMQPGGQYEGLLKCQEEGLIDHIVFSSHQPGHQIQTILNEGKLEGVLLGMNILNAPYRWDGVKTAYEYDYGTVAMNPLAGGMIPQNEDKLGFLAAAGEAGPTEAALRFAISYPYLNVALVGFTNKEQIDTACNIAERCEPFSDEDLQQIRSHLTENMTEICTACGYCEGCCPSGIPVPSYMQFYNGKQMFDTSDEEMKKKLSFEHEWGLLAARKGEAADCIRCGECEEKCTQNLNIIERLDEIAQWEKDLD